MAVVGLRDFGTFTELSNLWRAVVYIFNRRLTQMTADFPEVMAPLELSGGLLKANLEIGGPG
jgi:hypothetical protein